MAMAHSPETLHTSTMLLMQTILPPSQTNPESINEIFNVAYGESTNLNELG